MRKINYISTDKQSAINSYGQEFLVGQEVIHDDKEAGSATILSFEVNDSENEVRANTDKGYAHIDFIQLK